MAEQANRQTALDYQHPMTIGVLAAFLQTGRTLDHASSVLLLGTLLSVLQPFSGFGMALTAMAIVLAIAEKYYAWRIALDTGLFTLLLRQPQDISRFDAALAAFLGHAPAPAERSMQSRWQGARRLLRRQALCLVLQLVATLLALIACAWSVR